MAISSGGVVGPVVGVVGPGPSELQSNLIVGTTTIDNGVNGGVLYDNGGILGVLTTVVRTDLTATFTVGYTVQPNDLGIITSGTVIPNPANGNYQFGENNGSFTLAAPVNDTAIDIMMTNGPSAGTVTFSGFTVGSNTGFPLDTVSGHKFLISIRRINAIATYSIYALQ